MTTQNIDANEVNKFNTIGDQWWDPTGECQPLHKINPLRLAFIEKHIDLHNKKILDVGCGGGILAESLAKSGAEVTGIDLAEKAIEAAHQHSKLQQLNIHYQVITVEELAQQQPHSFDVVTCMEMLEHVPDPISVIKACSDLVKPNGAVFFSTLNRNIKAYLQAIVGAEFILKLLPKGTHDYAKFIRPSELASWCRTHQLDVLDMEGMTYQLFDKKYVLTKDVSVNYLVYCEKAST